MPPLLDAAPPPPSQQRPFAADIDALRLLIVTDAWAPQVNGVVRTLSTVSALLRKGGDTVEVIGPDRFRTVPAPSYPEIRLALRPRAALARMAETSPPPPSTSPRRGRSAGPCAPSAARAAGPSPPPSTPNSRTTCTPGPVSRGALPGRSSSAFTRAAPAPSPPRRACARNSPGAASPGSSHGPAASTSTCSSRSRAMRWEGLPRPVFLYAGRLAVEKNIEAFLRLDLPGSKVVVGDGPQRQALRSRFPAARFRRLAGGRGARRGLRRRRRVGVPLAHRHLRAGDPGGDGLRHAGRRLSGDRACSTSSARAAPACWTRISAARQWRPCGATGRAAAPMRRPSPGPPAPRPSAASSCPSGAERPHRLASSDAGDFPGVSIYLRHPRRSLAHLSEQSTNRGW